MHFNLYPSLRKCVYTAVVVLLSACASTAQYCVSNLSGGCGSGDYINSFSTTGGSTNISTTNTGCNSGNNSGFSYNFTQIHTGAAGSTVGFSLQNNPAVVEACKIWVDWNSDFDFVDAGEEVYSTTLAAGQTVTGSFIIPAATTGGSKRLRVRCVYNPPAPIEPCGQYIFGEIEDYDLVVTGGAPPPCTAPTGLAAAGISSSSATLSWTASGNATGYEYTLNQSATPPTGSGTAIAAPSYAASGLTPAATYYFHVRTVCGSAASAWTTTSFTTSPTTAACVQPTTLTVTNASSSSVSLTWTAVTGATGYEHANTTTATPPAAGTLVTTTTATYPSLIAGGVYYAHVRTKCGTTFSTWRTTQYTKSGATAVETIDGPDGFVLEALPNPASDVLTVRVERKAAARAAMLTLTDVAGRVLQQVPVTGKETTVQLARFPAGLYLLRYADAEHSRVVRVEKL